MNQDLLRWGEQRLRAAGVPDAASEAEFILAEALQIQRPALWTKLREPAIERQRRHYETWIAQRSKRNPLAYVLRRQPFLDLDLAITKAVLVPRPETETWVHEMTQELDRRTDPVTLLDVGTGSGAIGIALAMHSKVMRVIGVDRSTSALRVARFNARSAGVHKKCVFRESDLLSKIPRVDLSAPLWVTANLPYIRRSLLRTLQPEVRCEPALALDGGPTGFEVIARFLTQAEARLPSGSRVWMEIGYDQAQRATAQMKTSTWSNVQVKKDLNQLARVVTFRRV